MVGGINEIQMVQSGQFAESSKIALTAVVVDNLLLPLRRFATEVATTRTTDDKSIKQQLPI